MKFHRLSPIFVLFNLLIRNSLTHDQNKDTEVEINPEGSIAENFNYNYDEKGTKHEYVPYEDINHQNQTQNVTNETTGSNQLIESLRHNSRNAIAKVGYAIWKYWSDVTHKASVRSGNNIRFFLYTLKNPVKEQELFVESTILNDTNWDKTANVKIIIHGYKESGMDNSSQNTKNAYMQTNRSENIIVVDWQYLSKERNYFNAAKNTKIVGEAVADFIVELEQHGYIQSYKNVHVIGFSLGAQTAGIAGYFVQMKSEGGKLGRITALDPAGPSFEETVDEKGRIDKSDADFVDVIHCDQGSMVHGGHRGTELISGHADFYPNGGSLQPGCSSQSFISKVFSSSCSHIYCPKLFQQSILGRMYKGCQCEDWHTFETGFCECDDKGPHMGEFCSTNAVGQFYLRAEVPESTYMM